MVRIPSTQSPMRKSNLVVLEGVFTWGTSLSGGSIADQHKKIPSIVVSS